MNSSKNKEGSLMKKYLKPFIEIFFFLGAPVTLLASLWMKLIKSVGLVKVNDFIFMQTGIFPIKDHYYQPMINPQKHLRKPLSEERELLGIDLNINEQLRILSAFNYNDELLTFPLSKKSDTEFYYKNKNYRSGDAEYLYSMVRYFKPGTIIEIGSGASTLMVKNAITKNKSQNDAYTCRHICIEPYEHFGLEKIEVELIRERVEKTDKSMFKILKAGDMLLIDSSHIIKPQGDVLFEYLELLPMLNPGVIIHVHDIFTPRDYLKPWVYTHVFFNEQYLLEAFLAYNPNFRIIAALNYLSHNFRSEFSSKCPIFTRLNDPGREPAAFWMMKN